MACSGNVAKKTYEIIEFTQRLMKLHSKLIDNNIKLKKLQEKEYEQVKVISSIQEILITDYKKSNDDLKILKNLLTNYREHFYTLNDIIEIYKDAFSDIQRLFITEIETEKI